MCPMRDSICVCVMAEIVLLTPLLPALVLAPDADVTTLPVTEHATDVATRLVTAVCTVLTTEDVGGAGGGVVGGALVVLAAVTTVGAVQSYGLLAIGGAVGVAAGHAEQAEAPATHPTNLTAPPPPPPTKRPLVRLDCWRACALCASARTARRPACAAVSGDSRVDTLPVGQSTTLIQPTGTGTVSSQVPEVMFMTDARRGNAPNSPVALLPHQQRVFCSPGEGAGLVESSFAFDTICRARISAAHHLDRLGVADSYLRINASASSKQHLAACVSIRG